MNFMERFTNESAAENCFIEESVSLDVFVNRTSRPSSIDNQWDYEIRVFNPWGDHLLVHTESDAGFLCDCEECRSFGYELLDYYALHNALTWIEENGPFKGEVNIWSRSERLLADASVGFKVNKHQYECPYLKTMGEDLPTFAKRLTLKVSSYSNFQLTGVKANQ